MSCDVCASACASEPDGEHRDTGHDRRGRFTPGNLARMTHGGRSIGVQLALMDAKREALAERRAGILADLGGPENVSTIRADLVERYLELQVVGDWLGGNLLAEGVMTTKGKTRAATTLFLSVVDRLERLGKTIGLERRERDLSQMSLAEWSAMQRERERAEALRQSEQEAAPATTDRTDDAQDRAE